MKRVHGLYYRIILHTLIKEELLSDLSIEVIRPFKFIKNVCLIGAKHGLGGCVSYHETKKEKYSFLKVTYF